MDLARLLLQEKKYREALAHAAAKLHGYDRDQVVAMASDGLGQRADADADIKKLAASPAAVEAVRTAEVFGHRGDADSAFHWIEVAYDRMGPSPWTSADNEAWWLLQNSPFLAALYGDPRWAPLADRGWPRTMREVDRLVRDRIT